MCLAGLSPVVAQQPVSVSVALMNENVSLPFTRLNQLNPGAEVGVSLLTAQRERSTHYLAFKLGGYHHQYLANGFYLMADYHIQRPLMKNLLADFYGGGDY